MPTINSLTYEEAIVLSMAKRDELSPSQEMSLDSYISNLSCEDAYAFMCEVNFREFMESCG